MEVKVERMDAEPMVTGDDHESDAENETENMEDILKKIMSSESVNQLKQAIVWSNNFLKKEDIFRIKDIIHYLCTVAEATLTMTDAHLDKLVEPLKNFFRLIISFCYEWKCLSSEFETNFALFNSIQVIVKNVSDKLDDQNLIEKSALNQCLPLMLASMVMMVSTAYSLAEGALISRAITGIIMKMKANAKSFAEEWKELISYVTNVINLWKRIQDIDRNDAKSLSQLVVRLVDLSLSSDEFFRFISGRAIRCLSSEKDYSMEYFFIEYQYEISSHIRELLRMGSDFAQMGDICYRTTSLFGIKGLPKELLRYIIPQFVVRCDTKTHAFLQEMVKIGGKRPENLIEIYLFDIIRHMFYTFNAKPKSMKEMFSWVEKMSALSAADVHQLIRTTKYELVNPLLLLIAHNERSTLEAIAFIECLRTTEELDNEPQYELNEFITNKEALKKTLNDYFLSFIHKYEVSVQDYSVCRKDKLMATKSLIYLINFMDNQCIDTFRVKIFSTLKLIISEKFLMNRELLKLGIEAIDVFIKKSTDSYLSSQLLTISALLLPLMHIWPIEVSAIFKELIVQRQDDPTFKAEFKHLYFIPEMPELIEVTEVVKPFLEYGDTETEICEKITLVVNNINHDNNRVRSYSLEQLSTLLSRHQTVIYKKCIDSKESDCDLFVNNIVCQLISCLKSTDKSVVRLVAKCLGILGAIDPMRIDLEKPVICKEEMDEKFMNFNGDQFKVFLIRHLYDAMTNGNKTDEYCASFALQEVLKYLKNEEINGRRTFSLDGLPLEMRCTCLILQKTQYNRRANNTYLDAPVKYEPIFGSTIEFLIYKNWLNAWLKFLFQTFIFKYEETVTSEAEAVLSLVQSSQASSGSSQHSDRFDLALARVLDTHSIKGKVLVDCYLSLTRNQNFAQFLLPYIVIIALKNASRDKRYQIVCEVQTVIATLVRDRHLLNSECGHLSSQTVFRIYDYLKVWSKQRLALHKQHCKTDRRERTARLHDREFRGVSYFVSEETGISAKDLAELAFNCGHYCRSLRYLEEYTKTGDDRPDTTDRFQIEISAFQKTFIRLDEPDSVVGCGSMRATNPTISEQILIHEAKGEIQEALICCTKIVKNEPDNLDWQRKYLQISMDHLDQSEMVFTYGTGLIQTRPEWRPSLVPHVIEAVWRLGNWDTLDTLLADNDDIHPTFGSNIGELFALMNKKTHVFDEFESKVNHTRDFIAGPLSATAMDISAYVRGHKNIVQLHVLEDIRVVYDRIVSALNDELYSVNSMTNSFDDIIKIWDQRTCLVRKTSASQEPVLNAQRTLFKILGQRCPELIPSINRHLFKSWLMSTKTSRKSGNIQRSYNCSLEMLNLRDKLNKFDESLLDDIDNCEATVEAAKIKWSKDSKMEAIQLLKNQIVHNYCSSLESSVKEALNNLKSQFPPEELNEILNFLSYSSTSLRPQSGAFQLSNSQQMPDANTNKAFAKLQLLYAKYCDRNALFNQNTLLVLYRSVKAAAPQWEESHYNYASYVHKIVNNLEESKKNNSKFSLGKPEEIIAMKGTIVKSLAESLKYGVKHAHNSLPLMLNIWLDLATEQYALNSRSRDVMSLQLVDEIRKTVEKMNNCILDLMANTPLFIFFISFGQLTARVLHPIPSIRETLKRLLIKLIVKFPNQSLWLLMRSYNSSNQQRSLFFKEVFQKCGSHNEALSALIRDMVSFCSNMSLLCKTNPRDKRGKTVLSLKKQFPKLDSFINGKNSSILLPFGQLVNVTLPKSLHQNDFNPFPSKEVYIRSIGDEIEVMTSLQKPKKIRICGSDGKEYTILCKPNDDLRKDNCLIDFCNLLNRCFKRDAEARRRQLKVKTYLAISLSDECGLIEWIPGLLPFRNLVETQYSLRIDYNRTIAEVRKHWPQPQNHSPADRIHIFKADILPQFMPSVFGKWFAVTYTDPLSWYSARQAFTRSSAVFSIVGYLLGLGDRHGENILIEEQTGETVHVDLNCMFNKGEDFGVPEIVPFRLTHNMIDGMGVTGYEGTFRKACEHTLRVARDNKEALLNFVRPLRYDHLNEWNISQIQRTSRFETTNDTAEKTVFNIEARLNGIPSHNEKKLPKGISLSVEGQVEHVIKEATDVNNLGLMFSGWSAFI